MQQNDNDEMKVSFIKETYKKKTIEEIKQSLNDENKLNEETVVLLCLENVLPSVLKELFDSGGNIIDISDEEVEKMIGNNISNINQEPDYNTDEYEKAKELLRKTLTEMLKMKELEKRLTKELSTFTGPQLLEWSKKKPDRITPFLTKFVQNNDTTIKHNNIKKIVELLKDNIVNNIITKKTENIRQKATNHIISGHRPRNLSQRNITVQKHEYNGAHL